MQPPIKICSESALRFFFKVTLDRPDLSPRLVMVRHPRRLPTVLSVEELGRLLEVAPVPKYRAALGHCLWCWVARIRGGGPQDRRHQQHAHVDPGRAAQRTQGPQCHVVATAVGATELYMRQRKSLAPGNVSARTRCGTALAQVIQLVRVVASAGSPGSRGSMDRWRCVSAAGPTGSVRRTEYPCREPA